MARTTAKTRRTPKTASTRESKPFSNRLLQRFRSLECYPQVHAMLCDGQSLEKIARFIQEDAAELTEFARETLRRQLLSYRNTLPAFSLLTRHQGELLAQVKQRITDKYVEYLRLEEMYQLQRARVDNSIALERARNTKLKDLGGEITRTVDIVSRMHQIKVDLGVPNDSGGVGAMIMQSEVLEEARVQYDDRVVATLQNPLARGRVLDAVHKLLAAADAEVVDGTVDVREDGAVGADAGEVLAELEDGVEILR